MRANQKGAPVGPLSGEAMDTPLGRLLTPLASPPALDGRDREVSVVEGILVCLHCERWYPIRNGLPELLPDHLRNWEEDRDWLTAHQVKFAANGLSEVWETILLQTPPQGQMPEDRGARYKKAEMTVAQRSLPKGFFDWGLTIPFFSLLPNFAIDLIGRFVTAVPRLNCGLNGIILDLGVGFSWTTEWLVRLGYQAIGIDICRDYILAGLSRTGSNMPHLLVGDIENLPLRDECADAVLSFDALHHVPNRVRAMTEISRVMREGTKIVLIEPGRGHEHTPQSMEVTEQHGILEQGFNQEDLFEYIKNTPLSNISYHRTDIHSYDIFTLQKSGIFEPDTLTPRALFATIVVQPESGIVKSDTKPELTVFIENCGDTVWLNETPDGIGEVRLGASLFDANRTLIKEDYAKVVLPRPVSPGDRIQLRCALPPVLRPGSYIVELDMVIEGLLRFKSYAFQPFPWPLTVVDDHPQRERNGPVVAEADREIVPTEVSFEPRSIRQNTLPENRITYPPLTHLLLLAWQVVKTDGPLSLSRRVWNYLLWRLSTK